MISVDCKPSRLSELLLHAAQLIRRADRTQGSPEETTHGAGAAAHRRRSFGVTVLGLTVRLSGRAFGCGQQMTSALDVVGSNDTGEQAAMADAMEDARQL